MRCRCVEDNECGFNGSPQFEDCLMCLQGTLINSVNLLIECIEGIEVNFKVSWNMHKAIDVIKESNDGCLKLIESEYPGIVKRYSLKENVLVI